MLAAMLCLGLAAAPLEVSPPSRELVARLHLSPFYAKSTSALGIPIVASRKVSDAALREAAFIVTSMLAARPELARHIVKANIRLVVMAPTELTTDVPEHADLTPKAYWDRRARGLGATTARPAVSCAEENLLSFPGDPYETESICVHEFAHVIAQFALVKDAGFTRRLEALHAKARVGAWKSTYAATNVDEYWAEGVQSWFDTNRTNDAEHGDIDTREKLLAADPELGALIRQSLGDVSWRYRTVPRRTPAERASLGRLPEPLPRFAWPETAPVEVEPAGAGLVLSPVRGAPPASPPSSVSTHFTVVNASGRTVSLWWVDFRGQQVRYAELEPGTSYRQQTYVGHRWLVRAGDEVLGQFLGAAQEQTLELRP